MVIKIARIEPAHARELARLHTAMFPGFFLTGMGEAFLSDFYSVVATSRDSFGFIAHYGERTVGAIVCVASARRFWQRFLCARPGRLGALLLQAFVGARERRRAVWRRIAASRKLVTRSFPPVLLDLSPVVLSIGVLSDAQSLGAGEALVAAAAAELAKRGWPAVAAYTDRDNAAARRFFEANAFLPAGEWSVYGGREMLQYVRFLDTIEAATCDPASGAFGPALKRGLDILFGLVGLLAYFALYPFIAAFIKSGSKGPVLFRQKRVGRGGAVFDIYKFRSMDTSGSVTPSGSFLRRWSFDELPQFWNVLRGDMSLVGPRPDVPDEVAADPRLLAPLRCFRPGLTGLSQVSGRQELGVGVKIALDTLYARRWSLALDAKVLLLTISSVLGRRGAW
jgi:lipopolysaccharide/colanic/teichoic acid biosynthesis glycosyltransferase/ribosomal protein S18 acetylase RimI-like enzyme